MNWIKLIIFIIFINKIATEPFTVGVTSAMIFGLSSLLFNQKKIVCYFSECCDTKSKWLPMNITKLEEYLNSNLHGQHLVKSVLMRNLKSHIFSENPNRALIFSFNGMPGTGKNFVASMIANSLYFNGMNSKYVHIFISSVHFPLQNKVEEYKIDLQKTIIKSIKMCSHSMFIFDEVQDMPGNLLDAIKPFVDNYENIDGVDYRKAIFILLSNSGGKDINSQFIEAHRKGRERDSINLKEMEDALALNLYQMNNDGLRKSKLISHNLITAFVPFLPLEKKHVILCIKNLLREKSLENDDELIDKVIETLNFNVIEETIYIATQGCKRIVEKLQLIL